MSLALPENGAASAELAAETVKWWEDAAEKAGIDLTDFDSQAPFDQRIAWAHGKGLLIGTAYSRFSSKRQHSTYDQIRTCVQHAATVGIYCPPELVCVDEGQRGYRARRDGLSRMLTILKQLYATVLLVFKASRLYRQAFKGYQLIQQEVVEEGLRAISVTQGIDTIDAKAWKMLMQLHGMMDDMFIEATADHVRASLNGLFSRGYTVGAIPVGYRRKEIPQGMPTNRGLPRTMPEVAPDVGKMIVEHYQLIRNGLPIKQGWKKWVADGGPADPRSTTGRMSYQAYHRMLSRITYTGRWEFGRRRNDFSTKKDYTVQVPQPEDKVEKFICEELRIVDDELFFAVQKILAALKRGPQGPRKDKQPKLWDLVTDLFHCASCQDRFYMAGANGQGMQCKHGDLCLHKTTVRRKEAVLAVCEELKALVQRDSELIESVICRAQELDERGDDQLRDELLQLEKKEAGLNRKVDDLFELAGHGTDEDRKEVMGKIRSVRTERSTVQREISRLKQSLDNEKEVISPETVREILANFTSLLTGADTSENDDSVHRAANVFRALVGEKIWVHVEPRPGRKQTNVRGCFQPQIARVVSDETNRAVPENSTPSSVVWIWLRKPPRLDAIAERVHELIDDQGMSFRDAAKQLRKEGQSVNSGNVWYSYRRWYEMQNLPVPKLDYNNGHRRRSA